MKKSLLLLLSAVLLAAGGLLVLAQSGPDHDRLRKEQEARIAALIKQAEGDRAEMQSLRDRIESLLAETESLRSALAAARSAPEEAAMPLPAEAAPTVEAEEQSLGANFMKGLAKMFDDPEMRKSMKAQQGMGIRMMYGELFKQLNLTPKQTETAMDLLAERQMELSAHAMRFVGETQGQPDEQAGAALADGKREYDEQLRVALGESNFKRLEAYEKTIGDRMVLQQFDGQFSSAGAPLQEQQREALLRIIGEERERTPAAAFDASNPQAQIQALQNPEATEQWITAQEELDRRVLARARQNLNATQVSAFESIQKQSLELMRMQAKMSRAFLQK